MTYIIQKSNYNNSCILGAKCFLIFLSNLHRFYLRLMALREQQIPIIILE